MDEFDFAGSRWAFKEKDVAVWLAFYAEDAEWPEYRHDCRRGHRAG